jgi:hypothetical protein
MLQVFKVAQVDLGYLVSSKLNNL